MTSFSATDNFVLHMFLERYISDHVGNDEHKSMRAFVDTLEGIRRIDLSNIVYRGLLIVEKFLEKPLPPASSRYKYSFYRARAEEIISDHLGDGGSGPFIFPSGYTNGSGGHMIAVLFERDTKFSIDKDEAGVIVTYSNSGDGLEDKRYHRNRIVEWDDHTNNHEKLYEVCVSVSVNMDKAIDILARMLYQKNPRRHQQNENEERENGYYVFDSSLHFYMSFYLNNKSLNLNIDEDVLVKTFHSPLEVKTTVTDGIFKTARAKYLRGNAKYITYAKAQVTGTCTFHSIMWLLHHCVVNGTNDLHLDLESEMEHIEQAMRRYVFQRIESPTTSEARVCYRLISTDYSRIFGTIGSALPPPSLPRRPAAQRLLLEAKTEKLKSLPDYARRGEGFLVGAVGLLGMCSLTELGSLRIYDGVGDLLDDLRAVFKNVPRQERTAICGNHYITTLLNLAQSTVLHAMEGICKKGNDIKTYLANQGYGQASLILKFIVDIAETVLMAYPLFEGKDRHKMKSVNYWTEAYHRRYRRSVLKLCMLIISLQSLLPETSQEPPRQDNDCVRHGYFYDDSDSGEEAALLQQYVHFAWPVSHQSPYWGNDFKSPSSVTPFQHRNMIYTQSGPGVIRAARLGEVVSRRPVGYALVILTTLLASKCTAADSAFYHHYHSPIRASRLMFYECGIVYMEMQDYSIFARLPTNQSGFPIQDCSEEVRSLPGRVQPSSLQLAMEDAAAVVAASHANSVITERHLPRLLEADMARIGLAADTKHILVWGWINYHAESQKLWRALRARVVTGILEQVPAMHDRALAYFLVHLAAVHPDVAIPPGIFEIPANTSPGSFAGVARLFGRCKSIIGPDRAVTQGEYDQLWAYIIEHQAAMYIFGDSKVLWSALCTSPDREGDWGGGEIGREYVLCRLIIDWMVDPKMKIPQWTASVAQHLIPPHILSEIREVPRSGTSQSQDGPTTWTLNAESSSYVLPAWFFPRWEEPQDRTSFDIEVVPLDPRYVYTGEKTFESLQNKRVILSRYDTTARYAQTQYLVASCQHAPEVQVLLDQLRGGGFRCCVWANVEAGILEIIFSDSPAPARRGSLVCTCPGRLKMDRAHPGSISVVWADGDHEAAPWVLTWEGTQYSLCPETEVPEPMLEWGRPYVGGTVFWIRDAQTSPTLPSLLVLTSDTMEVDLHNSVFNRRNPNAEKKPLHMPRWTFLVPMHPNGRLPHLQHCKNDDMIILFALCQLSSKDQCLMYMYWYMDSFTGERAEWMGAEKSFMEKYLVRADELAHPFRHVVSFIYKGSNKCMETMKRRSLQNMAEDASALRSPHTADVWVNGSMGQDIARLVQSRLYYIGTERTARLPDPRAEDRDGGASMRDEYPTHPDELAQVRRAVAERDRAAAAAGHLLFPTAYQPADFYIMWYGKMRDAYERTKNGDRVDLVEMGLGRVHPEWVPGLDDQIRMMRDHPCLGIFQIAQGVLLGREQIQFLDRMWPFGQIEPPARGRIFQATMGMGKSSVLMPYLVLRGLRAPALRQIFIVQPEHLVADAVRTVRGLLGSTGGFYGPGKTDCAYLATRIPPSIFSIPGTNRKVVYVVSDTAMKEFILGSMIGEVQEMGGRMTSNMLVGRRLVYILDSSHSLVLYDEIDGMYAPRTSEFNIPHADFQFHPMAPAGDGSWPALYARAVMNTVLGHPTTDVPDNLRKKLHENFEELRTHWSRNYQYGRAGSPTGLLAVPYKAAQAPLDRSSFSDIDVTALLTASMLIEEGLLARDFDLLRQSLLTGWVKSFSGVPAGTVDELFRLTVTDRVSLARLLNTPSTSLAADAECSRDVRLIRYYVEGPLFQTQLRYYSRRYNMSFIDLMSICRYQLGFSGTVNMTLPETVDVKSRARLIPHEFSEIVESGETAALIRQAIAAGTAFGLADPKDLNAKGSMEERGMVLLHTGQFGVLIDACAMWRNKSADMVYKTLVDAGVLAKEAHRFVWLDDRDRALERVSVADGTETKRERWGVYRPEEALLTGAVPTFYYFDQRHSRGTDLILPADVQALVTVDVGRSTVTDIAQAAFRLRRILRGQQAHFLLSGPLADGKALYEQLEDNSAEEQKSTVRRHHIQAYKAALRYDWKHHRNGTAGLLMKRFFDLAYLEDTPYALHPAVALAPPEFDGAHAPKILTKLYRLAQGGTSGVGDVQLQMERDRERDTKRQRDWWSKSSNGCLPETIGAITLVSAYTYVLPGVKSSAGDMAHILGVALSPLIMRGHKGIFGRVYRRIGEGKDLRIIILTRSESMALPGTIQGEIVDVHMKETLAQGASAMDLLGHVLCGFTLDLADQLRLLVYVAPDPKQTWALRSLLKCFLDSELIDLSQCKILREFIRGGGDVAYMLLEFRKKHLGTDQKIMRYMFSSDTVVNFLCGSDISEERERIKKSLQPLLRKVNEVFETALLKVKVYKGRDIILPILSDPKCMIGNHIGVADFSEGGLLTFLQNIEMLQNVHFRFSDRRSSDRQEIPNIYEPGKRRKVGPPEYRYKKVKGEEGDDSELETNFLMNRHVMDIIKTIIVKFHINMSTLVKSEILKLIIEQKYSALIIEGENHPLRLQDLNEILSIGISKRPPEVEKNEYGTRFQEIKYNNWFTTEVRVEGNFSVFHHPTPSSEPFSCSRCHRRRKK